MPPARVGVAVWHVAGRVGTASVGEELFKTGIRFGWIVAAQVYGYIYSKSCQKMGHAQEESSSYGPVAAIERMAVENDPLIWNWDPIAVSELEYLPTYLLICCLAPRIESGPSSENFGRQPVILAMLMPPASNRQLSSVASRFPRLGLCWRLFATPDASV